MRLQLIGPLSSALVLAFTVSPIHRLRLADVERYEVRTFVQNDAAKPQLDYFCDRQYGRGARRLRHERARSRSRAEHI